MNTSGPGWNDPPSLTYEVHTQTTARKNLLTKRVGLPDLKVPEKGSRTPLSGEAPPSGEIPYLIGSESALASPNDAHVSSKPSQTVDTTASPSVESVQLQAGDKPQVSIFNPLQTSENEQNHKQEKDQLEDEENENEDELGDIEIVNELRTIANKCLQSNVISKQVSNVIAKKINALEHQLKEEKLPKVVEGQMEKLTEYLIRKKYDDAWKIHVALMCDHSSSVIQWMVGVKRLITEAKKL